MVTIRILQGDTEHCGRTYRGLTAESIVRRLYGRRAEVRWSQEVGGAEIGTIVVPIPTGGWSVMATFRYED